MSRIGKRPIAVPSSVKVDLASGELTVKGPKGESRFTVPEKVALEVEPAEIRIVADHERDTRARSLMGTVQATVQNMVTGVSEGFSRQMNLVGVGYRAAVSGNVLEMSLGFSQPVRFELPAAVSAEVVNNTQLTLSCHDKVLLGQTCARIRKYRPPEPYQGKGIHYAGERIRRKAGKSGKK